MTDAEKLLRRTFAAHEPELDPSTESEMFARIAAAVRGGQGEGDAGTGNDPEEPGSAGGGILAGDDGEPTGPEAPFGRPYLVEPHEWTPGELSFSPEPRRRRRVWLGGAAAGIVLATSLAVATIGLPGLEQIVGTVIGPQPTVTSMPSPSPTPTFGAAVDLPDTPGPLTPEQTTLLLSQLEGTLHRFGTMRVVLQYASAGWTPDPNDPLAGDGSQKAEVDVRDPLEVRTQTADNLIRVGDKHWGGSTDGDTMRTTWTRYTPLDDGPTPLGGPQLVLDPFMWTQSVRDKAVVIGRESINELSTVHYRLSVPFSDEGEPLPAEDDGTDQRPRLDLWVDSTARIIKGRLTHRGGDWESSSVEYGVPVTITAPTTGTDSPTD